MGLSEYEIRKLDQRFGEAEDRFNHPRCPICTCRLIIARGSGGGPSEVFKHPTCPICGYERVKVTP